MDEPTHPTFEAWIAELEAIMDDWGKKHEGRPYGNGTLAETTGLSCWMQSYDEGLSPQDAFDEDRDCWD